MMHWVGGHVDGGDVVAVHHCGLGQGDVKLAEELLKLVALSDGVGDCPVLSLSARSQHRRLTLRAPGDQ